MTEASTETELTLAIAPTAIRRLYAHRLLADAAASPAVRLRTTYFDTPGQALRSQGIALRVRYAAGSWMQTVKSAGTVRGVLHVRPQQECPLAGETPDPSAITAEALAPAFAHPEVRDALEPCFTTDFRRRSWLVRADSDAFVEVSLDRGEIRAGMNRERLCELELELKSGAPRHIYRLALDLAADLPLKLQARSKAERAFALLDGTPGVPEKARPSAVRPDMSVSQAFASIAWSAFDQIHGNYEGVVAGEDPEYIHQMRVGVRRLRSAFRVFRPMLTENAVASHVEQLRWLARALGPARDWDVFLAETYPPMREAFGDCAALAAFETACARRRGVARKAAVRAVASARYQRLMLELACWVSDEGWNGMLEPSARLALEQPISPCAKLILDDSYDRVRRRARGLGAMGPLDRHALRIALKRLRYATDFFSRLCEPAGVRELLGHMSRLQDILGAMNDVATAERLLREVAIGGASGSDAEARGIVLGWSRGRAVTLQRELKRAWKTFRDCGKPWQ